MFESGGPLFLLLLALTLAAVHVSLDRLYGRRVAWIVVGVLVALAVAIALFLGYLATTYAGDGGGWRPTR